MKKPKIRKPYHFYNDLYFENFYFCPGYTAEEFKQAIINNTGIESDVDLDGVRAHCRRVNNWSDGRGGIFFWTKDAKINAAQVSSITHESWHAVMGMFESRGILLCTKNDEPGAYLIGWITSKLFACLEMENAIEKRP